MNRKRRVRRKSRTRPLIALALVLGAVIVGGLILLSQQPAPNTETALPDLDSAFSLPDHVGQPALTFSALGLDGKPHTVTPGDGRAKAIVFYMGFR